jgi:antirestriction protein
MQTHTESAAPAVAIHKISNLTDQPAVYVGTFAKYNSGNLSGAWLDVSAYNDREDFIEAALALHADEDDPELMFQDFQGFPRIYYGESEIDFTLWDWLALDDDEREMVELYQNEVDASASLECIKEAYLGTYDSAEAWAEQWLEEMGELARVPESLFNYIDFAAYAKDMRMSGVVTFVENGWRSVLVFSNR